MPQHRKLGNLVKRVREQNKGESTREDRKIETKAIKYVPYPKEIVAPNYTYNDRVNDVFYPVARFEGRDEPTYVLGADKIRFNMTTLTYRVIDHTTSANVPQPLVSIKSDDELALDALEEAQGERNENGKRTLPRSYGYGYASKRPAHAPEHVRDPSVEILMGGVTEDKCSICVRVENFHPYCYIGIPFEWLTYCAENYKTLNLRSERELLETLCARLHSFIGAFTLDKCRAKVKPFSSYSRYKSLIRSESELNIKQRIDMYGYNGDVKVTQLRFVVCEPSFIVVLRSMFWFPYGKEVTDCCVCRNRIESVEGSHVDDPRRPVSHFQGGDHCVAHAACWDLWGDAMKKRKNILGDSIETQCAYCLMDLVKSELFNVIRNPKRLDTSVKAKLDEMKFWAKVDYTSKKNGIMRFTNRAKITNTKDMKVIYWADPKFGPEDAWKAKTDVYTSWFGEFRRRWQAEFTVLPWLPPPNATEVLRWVDDIRAERTQTMRMQPAFSVYEANIPFVMRSSMDSTYRPCKWIELEPGTYRNVPVSERLTYNLYELKVQHKDVKTVPETDPIYNENAAFVVMGFDTEMESDNGAFCNPDRSRVLQIPTVLYRIDTDEERHFMFCVEDLGEGKLENCTVFVYKTEKAMLQGWFRFSRCVMPDYVTTYNGDNFDFPFTLKRGRLLSIPEGRNFLSRLQAIDMSWVSAKKRTTAITKVKIPGVVNIDMLTVFRFTKNWKSYGLNMASSQMLKETKIDLPYQLIDQLQQFPMGRYALAIYSRQDAYLTIRLFKVSGVQKMYGSRSEDSGVTTQDLIDNGALAETNGSILLHISNNDIRLFGDKMSFPTFRPKAQREEIDIDYEGALVIKPIKGLYLPKSLYHRDYIREQFAAMSDDERYELVSELIDEVLKKSVDGTITTVKPPYEDVCTLPSWRPQAKGSALHRSSMAIGDGEQVRVVNVNALKDNPEALEVIKKRIAEDWDVTSDGVVINRLTDTPVSTLDFNSLYPNLMICWNYCYTTILFAEVKEREIANGRLTEDDIFTVRRTTLNVKTLEIEEIIGENDPMFVKRHIRLGAVPDLQESLKTRRAVARALSETNWKAQAAAKDELAKLNAQCKDIEKTEEQVAEFMRLNKLIRSTGQASTRYNVEQEGRKQSMNAIYGGTGAAVNKFPCRAIALSITTMGQHALQRAYKIACTEITFEKGWGCQVRVIYGDTDSIFIIFPGLHMHDSRNYAVAISEHLAMMISAEYDRAMKIVWEKMYIYQRMMRKKGYFGSKFDGKNVITMDIKGAQAKRRDSTLFQQVCTAMIQQYLDSQNPMCAIMFYVEAMISFQLHEVPLYFVQATGSFTKPLDDKDAIANKAMVAARKMRARDGRDIPVGERIHFVVVSVASYIEHGGTFKNREEEKKTTLRSESYEYAMLNEMKYDTEYYTELFEKSFVTMLIPLIPGNNSDEEKKTMLRNMWAQNSDVKLKRKVVDRPLLLQPPPPRKDRLTYAYDRNESCRFCGMAVVHDGPKVKHYESRNFAQTKTKFDSDQITSVEKHDGVYKITVRDVNASLMAMRPQSGLRPVCGVCKSKARSELITPEHQVNLDDSIERIDKIWSKCARCRGSAISEVQIANCETSTCSTWGERVYYGNYLFRQHSNAQINDW